LARLLFSTWSLLGPTFANSDLTFFFSFNLFTPLKFPFFSPYFFFYFFLYFFFLFLTNGSTGGLFYFFTYYSQFSIFLQTLTIKQLFTKIELYFYRLGNCLPAVLTLLSFYPSSLFLISS
jgi:hypothetical protein